MDYKSYLPLFVFGVIGVVAFSFLFSESSLSIASGKVINNDICRETDGGADPLTRGTTYVVTNATGNVTNATDNIVFKVQDYCDDSVNLVEYTCRDNAISSDTVSCSSCDMNGTSVSCSCVNGACVPNRMGPDLIIVSHAVSSLSISNLSNSNLSNHSNALFYSYQAVFGNSGNQEFRGAPYIFINDQFNTQYSQIGGSLISLPVGRKVSLSSLNNFRSCTRGSTVTLVAELSRYSYELDTSNNKKKLTFDCVL